jgi:hypothetical protein
MPHGVHNLRARTYRPDPELYALAQAAVKIVGSDMNTHINGFLRWLVRETDELPQRPESRPEPRADESDSSA